MAIMNEIRKGPAGVENVRTIFEFKEVIVDAT